MIVVLDNLRSALNVGSIIRTCDALGISQVYCCGITPGPDNPKVQKTSLGAEKSVNCNISDSTLETVRSLKQSGYHIAALELSDSAIPLDQVEVGPGKELVMVVGNEVSGITPDVLAISDTVIMIPMLGDKESLNVSVAFGIAAYQLSLAKKDL